MEEGEGGFRAEGLSSRPGIVKLAVLNERRKQITARTTPWYTISGRSRYYFVRSHSAPPFCPLSSSGLVRYVFVSGSSLLAWIDNVTFFSDWMPKIPKGPPQSKKTPRIKEREPLYLALLLANTLTLNYFFFSPLSADAAIFERAGRVKRRVTEARGVADWRRASAERWRHTRLQSVSRVRLVIGNVDNPALGPWYRGVSSVRYAGWLACEAGSHVAWTGHLVTVTYKTFYKGVSYLALCRFFIALCGRRMNW